MKISGLLKRTFSFASVLCLFFAAAVPASAQSTSELIVGGEDLTVGDTFTVDIQMNTDEGKIYRYMGQLIYDDSMLQFDAQNSSTYDIINGEGGIVKMEGFAETPGDSVSITVAFKAISDGNTVFSLANTALFAEDGTLLGQPVASTDIIGILNGEPETTTAATTSQTVTTTTTKTTTVKKTQTESTQTDESEPETQATQKTTLTAAITQKASSGSQNDNQYEDLALQVYIMLALIILIAAGIAFYWYRKKYGKAAPEPAKKKPARKSTGTKKKSTAKRKK